MTIGTRCRTVVATTGERLMPGWRTKKPVFPANFRLVYQGPFDEGRGIFTNHTNVGNQYVLSLSDIIPETPESP